MSFFYIILIDFIFLLICIVILIYKAVEIWIRWCWNIIVKIWPIDGLIILLKILISHLSI